jgi:putative SbcD/Mre11-related phosphoesterase
MCRERKTMRVDWDWWLTPERAALHLPTGTAVIADLHLGYDQVRCRGGDALPEFGLDEAIAALKTVILRHNVRRLLIAGDFCEDGRRQGSAAQLLTWLKDAGLEWLGIIPGNHDRGLDLGEDLVQVCPEGVTLGPWHVVHGDGPLPRGRVVHGHVHPCFRWGNRIDAPCFLVGTRRLVLPAFSADAAGVNVLGDLRWRSFRCCVPAEDQVLDFGEVGDLRRKKKAGATGQ